MTPAVTGTIKYLQRCHGTSPSSSVH